ncbi:MAG: glutaredoxin family protein [Candidatus Hydrothermarchaeota archaeon]
MKKEVRINIEFYTKKDCPLCEKAESIIEELRHVYNLDVKKVDITQNPEIYERYRQEIPVIRIHGRYTLKGVIDKKELRKKMETI